MIIFNAVIALVGGPLMYITDIVSSGGHSNVLLVLKAFVLGAQFIGLVNWICFIIKEDDA